MADCSLELHSFIGKFMQLSASGFTANLSLSNTEGIISVNLNAVIGSLGQNIHAATCSDNVQLKKSMKPSQVRRRRRRRLAKTNVEVQDKDTVENFQPPPSTNIIDDDLTAAENVPTYDGPTTTNQSQLMPIISDANNGTLDVEFGDEVSRILSELHSNNLSTATDDVLSPSTPSSPLQIQLPKPISKAEFFSYMEDFGNSLGNILQKKLSSVIDDPAPL